MSSKQIAIRPKIDNPVKQDELLELEAKYCRQAARPDIGCGRIL